ncbi:MAG: metallophosphoesterase [Kouleothrix sp.]
MTTTTSQHFFEHALDLVTHAITDHTAHDEWFSTLPTEPPRTNPLDPIRTINAPAWMQAGAVAAGLGALGLKLFGGPAAVSLGALGAASLLYAQRWEPAHPTLEHVTLHLAGLPAALDGLRIGHITDTHLGLRYTECNLAWAVAEMQHAQPELIALTGDFAGLKAGVPLITPLLQNLRAPLGIYAVAGNHDYWEGLADVRGALALAGIPLLVNRSLRLRWNSTDFWLTGIDDVFDGRPDFAAACADIPEGAFKLLLAHSPDLADNAQSHGFALQLSGHSHGGHLRLPRIGPITHPRYGVRYVMGHYFVGAMQLYVSRGLGGTPLRFLCRPEATIFTLRRA